MEKTNYAAYEKERIHRGKARRQRGRAGQEREDRGGGLPPDWRSGVEHFRLPGTRCRSLHCGGPQGGRDQKAGRVSQARRG